MYIYPWALSAVACRQGMTHQISAPATTATPHTPAAPMNSLAQSVCGPPTPPAARLRSLFFFLLSALRFFCIRGSSCAATWRQATGDKQQATTPQSRAAPLQTTIDTFSDHHHHIKGKKIKTLNKWYHDCSPLAPTNACCCLNAVGSSLEVTRLTALITTSFSAAPYPHPHVHVPVSHLHGYLTHVPCDHR